MDIQIHARLGPDLLQENSGPALQTTVQSHDRPISSAYAGASRAMGTTTTTGSIHNRIVRRLTNYVHTT